MKPEALAGSVAPPFSAWERSVAARYLRSKRKNGGVALISIISFIGIMLAVAVLIIVMSVMNGFRTELLGKMLGFNGHLFVSGQVLSDPVQTFAATQRIRRADDVIQAVPMVEAQAMAIGPAQITGAIVRGISPADLKATPIIAGNIKRGSLDNFGRGEFGGDTIMMGDRLAEGLGVQPGDVVKLVSPSGPATAFGTATQEKDYVVGGVFSVGMTQFDAAFIYMPMEQAQLFFGRDQSVDVIEVKVQNPDRARDMRPVVSRAAGPGAFVSDWTQKDKAYFDALQVERAAMRLILMMIVAIAALNIISGLVMLVKNKGKDIAILRTMGAGQGAILRIFFMAGASIGVLGTLAGLAAGVLFCTFIEPIQKVLEAVTGTKVFNAEIYFLSHIPARIEWSEVGIVTLFAMIVSFLVTLPPAWRAAHLDPVEALRYE
ncbi:lipoprotein-releasing ABC transporter permease subunit [Caulobacter sp. NIBR2454]|uniref:lipoprotein-releasing ABC transporter permease subunit n=1 Tax=Caulobacter sp. NIBR2454 TaxID=3015996 RepID=UPI0022B6B71A|nr:lipoprotein-releasing ABC transporter permease subunit [Caulobacter sp. NIBR2454]